MKKKLCSLVLSLMLAFCLFPAAVSAQSDTFTVTYKTNAEVEMGTVVYTVGGQNALPVADELTKMFRPFFTRAFEKGSVSVPNNGVIWYEDSEFKTPAQFPQGAQGENYTLYCKLAVRYFSAGNVQNRAENASYANTRDSSSPCLAITGQSMTGRSDAYEGTRAIFEKKNADGEWVEVPERYYTDPAGTEWATMIYFKDVSDSGVYRLKDVRYTATDNSGNILYYVNAEDTSKDEHTVNITPVELTISDVQAVSRGFDGTNKVALSGGALNGILFNDDVTFELGTGLLADAEAGENKPVTTDIKLTGEKAGNYTLVQPTDIQVTITPKAAENTEADTNNKAKTGDESNFMFPLVMMLIAVSGIGAVAFRKNRA